MIKAPSFTKSGSRASSETSLSNDVFTESVVNHELLKTAYDAYLANGRANLARTKKRGQVRGGGRKPWQQKGTGRARAGSIRSPIWRGGGITFGPSGEENYTKEIPKTAKRKALRQALSLAAKSGKLKIIEDFVVKSGKTKDAAALLTKLNASGNVLIVVKTKDIDAEKALQNVPKTKLLQVNYLNVFDTLNADNIIISKESLDVLDQWLVKPKSGKS